ncbi:adenylate/guanylate cyclase domain-containing protein [Kiloniella laminariae]|uniref:Adenylate/guanylate cyclase domain-containing protein n=1 Tax=Kiloniella laminariae TaxID=454162 RepID=A0ABT4LJR0_9PROT|nr:adenylate/guanylate cyclase domain-containing protein [Kiloniella laminariae]MCZ4281343.1 adenylate/guanylate cyclase domain-containing protein [Kiloniella laminariae]
MAVDKELYEFHFGSLNGWETFDEKLDQPIDDCCVMAMDFCSYSAFVRETSDIALAHKMLSAFCDGARDILIESGALVDRVQGDGLLAVWGVHHKVNAPKILQVAARIHTLAQNTASVWQDSIDRVIETQGARIGLSYGPVTLLSLPTAYPGFSLLSEIVNLAARLEARADPGTVFMTNRFENLLPTEIQKSCENLSDEDGLPGLKLKNVGRVQAFRWTPPSD